MSSLTPLKATVCDNVHTIDDIYSLYDPMAYIYVLHVCYLTRTFTHCMFPGFKKSFRDTRKVFLGSLHVVSACHLPLKWTPCKSLDPGSGLCWGMAYNYGRKDQYPTDRDDFYFNHRVDESVSNGDFRTVDREAEAVLYHIQIHRTKLRSSIEEIERYRDQPSRYATHFFPAVLQALDHRNLLMPMTVTYNLDNPPFAPPPSLNNSSNVSVRKHSSTLPLRASGDRSALYLASFFEGPASDADFTLVTMLYRDQDSPSSNSSRLYSCHIRHTSTSKVYSVSAELILGSPVNLIRCPLSAKVTTSAVEMWARRDECIAASIFTGEVESMSFEVPWHIRINSKLWQPATESIETFSPPAKRLVSIVSSSRIDLASYLQHIQQSTNAGIDHVYLLADRPPHSNHVAHLARVLQSYISSGLLTIVSSDARGTSLPPLMHGFLRTTVAAMYLKGSCSHILLTDTEEFLVPSAADGLKALLAAYTASQSAFLRQPSVDEANTCVYGLIRRVVMLADMQEKPWIRDKLEYMRKAVVKEHFHPVPLVVAASLVNIHYHPTASFSFQCASPHLLSGRDSFVQPTVAADLGSEYTFPQPSALKELTRPRRTATKQASEDRQRLTEAAERVLRQLQSLNLDLPVDMPRNERGFPALPWLDYRVFYKSVLA